MIINQENQRALVLSGGGALGAYEAGAILELCEYLIEKDKQDKKIDNPVFNTVSGTSIGSINACILVSEYLENRKKGIDIVTCWRIAAQKLVDFWKYCSFPSSKMKKIINTYKKKFGKDISKDTSEESLRRYIAGWYFLNYGLEKVFSKPQIIQDKRFGNKTNTWYKYNSNRLEDSIRRFANFPIATSFENKEPRLLVIGVDVQEGETVTFDSYSKPDGFRKAQCGYEENAKKFEPMIKYPHDLTLTEVMGSSASSAFYDYKVIHGRKIWDGFLRSNTPFRETINEHKAYWEWKIGGGNFVDSILNKNGQSSTVPDLELYVVDLYPKKENNILHDYDAIKNRIQNITYCDKSEYDELKLKIHYDLSEAIQKLAKLAIEKGCQKDIELILDMPAESRPYTYFPKKKSTYQDILKGIFKTNVIRIERKDDEHSVWSQWADFTDTSIDRLIDEGRRDTKQKLEQYDNQ